MPVTFTNIMPDQIVTIPDLDRIEPPLVELPDNLLEDDIDFPVDQRIPGGLGPVVVGGVPIILDADGTPFPSSVSASLSSSP